MAAYVEEPAQHAVACARDQDRLAACAPGEEGSAPVQLAEVADVLPAAAEDPLLLAAQDLGVDVPGVGKRLLDRANLPAYHGPRELAEASPEGVRRAAAGAAGHFL